GEVAGRLDLQVTGLEARLARAHAHAGLPVGAIGVRADEAQGADGVEGHDVAVVEGHDASDVLALGRRDPAVDQAADVGFGVGGGVGVAAGGGSGGGVRGR